MALTPILEAEFPGLRGKLFFDGNYLYSIVEVDVGGGDVRFDVVQISPDDLTEVARWTNTEGNNVDVSSIGGDGSFLYIGIYVSPGVVIKVDLSTMLEDDRYTAGAGDGPVLEVFYKGNATGGASLFAVLESDGATNTGDLIKIAPGNMGEDARWTGSMGSTTTQVFGGEGDDSSSFRIYVRDAAEGDLVKINISDMSENERFQETEANIEGDCFLDDADTSIFAGVGLIWRRVDSLTQTPATDISIDVTNSFYYAHQWTSSNYYATNPFVGTSISEDGATETQALILHLESGLTELDRWEGDAYASDSFVLGLAMQQVSEEAIYLFASAFRETDPTKLYKFDVSPSSVTAPTTSTGAATRTAPQGATLNGTLDDDGGEACECSFEWGLTNAYGQETDTQSKETEETFSVALTGLIPGSLYHFRAKAVNSADTGYGEDQTFRTLPGGNISLSQSLYQHMESMK
jgi:hypothetical protein